MGTFQGRPALIIAAGPETEYGYIKTWLQAHPDAVILCADGGLRHARALGVTPELMITDRDSCTETEGVEVILLPEEKDDTDTQACVRQAFARGCTEATLVCATGGRLDHLLANLSLLEETAVQGNRLTLRDAQNMAFLHPGGRQVYEKKSEFRFFSLVPLDAEVRGVTIENAKYPLQHATLHRARMISVSNEMTAEKVAITVESGHVLIVFSRD